MLERILPSEFSASSFVESVIRTRPERALIADRAVRWVERVTAVEQYPGILDKTRKHLETGSVIVYFAPHTNALDPMAINDQFVLPQLRRHPDQIIAWVTSGKFTGHVPGSTMGIFSELKNLFEETRGVTLLPVIQEYLVTEGKIPAEEAARINKETWDTMLDLVSQPGTVIAIAPEGTRAQTGGLQRANSSVGRLLRHHSNAAALPLYVEGAHRIQPARAHGLKGMRPWARVTLGVGPLITREGLEELMDNFAWKNPDMKRFKPSDGLMMHLLNRHVLPWMSGQDPRGVYSWNNVVDMTLPEFPSDEVLTTA